MQPTGVVYLATGGDEQRRLLARSRAQLQRWHPELRQHVVTDEEGSRVESAEPSARRGRSAVVGATLEQSNARYGVVEVIVSAGETDWLGRIPSVSVSPVSRATGFASRAFKTRLNRYSPFKRSLYLDTDTIVTRRLDALWSYLDRAPLAAALDIHRTVGRAVESSLKDRLLSRDEADVTACECGEDAPYFNTGVLLWQRGSETDRFFQTWHQEWQRFGGRDQFAFARALFRCRMRVASLPTRYNVPVVPGLPRERIEDACILHFWLPPKLDRMRKYGFGAKSL